MDLVPKQEDEEEVMEEFSWMPQPMEGLQLAEPAPFLRKTYDMVEDPGTDVLVSWGTGRSSFVVWDSHRFAAELLPRFFKHSNFFSFVRQLNTYVSTLAFLLFHSFSHKIDQRRKPPSICSPSSNNVSDDPTVRDNAEDCNSSSEMDLKLLSSEVPYMAVFTVESRTERLRNVNWWQGFRKIDPDRWEFANKCFLRGQRHLLNYITRRRPASQNPHQHGRGSCLEAGRFRSDGEIERLRMDRNELTLEVMRLRQEQRKSRSRMLAMEDRIQGTELKQQQVMAFLARAMRNPSFICNLLKRLEQGREIAGISKRKKVTPSSLIGEKVGGQIANCSGEPDEESDLSWGIATFFSELQNESYPSSCCQRRENELHKDTSSCSQGCENQLPSFENARPGLGALEDDNDVWGEILNDEIVVLCGGERPLETRLNAEDLVALSSNWCNDLKMHGVPGKEEEEEHRGSPPVPRPMRGLQDAGAAPFLRKTYEMVEDPATDALVSWGSCRSSFIVWDSHRFAAELLPCFFKHNNFSSFVRQLNTYGFRKVHPDRWEFANEWFQRGRKQLLTNIKRRKPASQSPHQQRTGACLELAQFGVDGEVERLRKDRNMLMGEVTRLRQQQLNSRAQMVAMQDRIQGTEMKQQCMMEFLARAVRNPAFMSNLVLHQEQRKEIQSGDKRKRSLLLNRTSEADRMQLYDHQDGEEAIDSLEITTLLSALGDGPGSSNQSRDRDNQLLSSPNMGSGMEAFDGDDDDVWQEILNNQSVLPCEGDRQSEMELNMDDFVARSPDLGDDKKLPHDTSSSLSLLAYVSRSSIAGYDKEVSNREDTERKGEYSGVVGGITIWSADPRLLLQEKQKLLLIGGFIVLQDPSCSCCSSEDIKQKIPPLLFDFSELPSSKPISSQIQHYSGGNSISICLYDAPDLVVPSDEA
ncbi:Heat shock factor protein [Nymphaea thermarum]|nr:Heat shock factor protein [Nymphaea thermarum]